MRVLMLAQSVAPIVGGEERMVEDLSAELLQRGHEVSIATLEQPGAQPQTLAGVPIETLRSTTYRLPMMRRDADRRHAPPAPDPETVVDLRRVLRERRPQIVHAHNWLVHSYLPLHRRSGAPLVLSLHDYDLLCATKRLLYEGAACNGPGPLKCMRCAADHYGTVSGPIAATSVLARTAKLHRLVDMFLPVSGAVERLCRIGPEDRSQVVPNFIGELPPPPGPDPRLDQLPQEPYILFLGDATEDKGAWNLAEAYDHLVDPPPLVFLGRNYLAEVAERPGIHMLGPWPHPLAMETVRRALFTVVPSVCPEAFGIVALEAAANGKATVASDIGGLPDVVRDGETGLLVAPGDRDALGAAMQRLIEDGEVRDRLGGAARERARRFSPDNVVPQFEGAYRTALEARGLRPAAASL
jgi:glycosyltransferase involved in cell wall biosynthesis